MMDEIKLKNGIVFNCNSNEVTGFLTEQLNTKTMFENILSISKKKESSQLPVYVNQWRFRSTRGLVYNNDFYFNTGSFDCNKMIL